MPHPATARALEPDAVGRLAKFFPQAMPVRIPIKVIRAAADSDSTVVGEENSNVRCKLNGAGNHGGNGNGANGTDANSTGEGFDCEETVIEFGTACEVLFTVRHPLEFADRVLLQSTDGYLRAEASVVAVRYHPERTAIAARFLKPVPNWIVKS